MSGSLFFDPSCVGKSTASARSLSQVLLGNCIFLQTFFTAIFTMITYYKSSRYVSFPLEAIQGLDFFSAHVDAFPYITSGRLSVLPACDMCHTFKFLTPAVVSQNVNNKSSVVCVRSKKYAFLVTLRLQGSMRLGKAELCKL